MWVKCFEAVQVTWSGSSRCAFPVKGLQKRSQAKGRVREAAGGAGGEGVKMTLLEITTATLNVLHYKICDKTFLWGGP